MNGIYSFSVLSLFFSKLFQFLREKKRFEQKYYSVTENVWLVTIPTSVTMVTPFFKVRLILQN